MSKSSLVEDKEGRNLCLCAATEYAAVAERGEKRAVNSMSEC